MRIPEDKEAEEKGNTSICSTSSGSSGPTGFKGIRASKFRHVYGTGSRKQSCYEDIRISKSPYDSQFCAVNPKFIAVVLEVAGGGAFQVLPLEWTGKANYHHGRIRGHNGPVTDIKWNPFNDNVIASSSDDATVKLWYIQDGGLPKSSLVDWLIELTGHTRRVSYIEWHPTAENVLATSGQDHKIFIWNVATGECMVDVDCHVETILSMAWNRIGSLLATTSKDKQLRVLNPRTGELMQSGRGHDSAKPSKVIFVNCGPTLDRLCTTGFSKTSGRQIALWNPSDLRTPLQLVEVDFSSGTLFPFYDYDTSLVFIAGKGDGNIRYYEVCNDHLYYISEFRSSQPQHGFGIMPKRGLKTQQCEIFRMVKVHTTQPLIEPIGFIVPRRAEMFHADLYPPTPGPTPALTADEWICGIDREPVKINLNSNTPATTCKPVRVETVGGDARKLLITSDRNNERKFQFLSQTTVPDYREVTEREDYSEIMKEKKLLERLSLGGKIFDREPKSPPTSTEDTASSNEGQTSGDRRPPGPLHSSPVVRRRPPAFRPAAMSTGEELSPRPSRPAPRAYDSSPATPGDMSGASGTPSFYTPTDVSFPTAGRFDPVGRGIDPIQSELEGPSRYLEDVEPPSPVGTAPLACAEDADSITTPKTSLASTKSNPTDHSVCDHPEDPGDSTPHQRPSLDFGGPSHLDFEGPSPELGGPSLAHPLAYRASSASPNIPTSASFDLSKRSTNGSQTRPGRIGPAPIIPTSASVPAANGNTAQVKPFYHRTPTRNASQPSLTDHQQSVPVTSSQAAQSNGTVTSNGSSVFANLPPGVLESPSKREVELQKLYAVQCKQVRSLLDDKESSERRLQKLEEDLQKMTARYQKLELNFDRQSEEIDCLRHEISWKDVRIDELQNNLYRLAAMLPDEALNALQES